MNSDIQVEREPVEDHDTVIEIAPGTQGDEVGVTCPPDNLSSEGTSLSWRDITYRVPRKKSLKDRMICCRRRSESDHEKIILLDRVSGCVPAGKAVAVMGPSGCGKSTLLDVLAGRISKGSDLTGEILVNGVPVQRKAMKGLVAYVMQDDALQGVLTVKENLMYSALLRLPEAMPLSEKESRVEEVIDELGLRKVANTKIGNVFFRGVSGGERRRCSIGMELITKPQILLLDEPTSGLDALSARMICETLVRMASQGRTVIATIHQPSSQVFQLFDRLLLLSRGQQVFFGPLSYAAGFFERSGYPVPPMTNPADHYLETINYDFATERPAHITALLDNYASSPEKHQLLGCIDGQSGGPVETSGKYETGWWTQFRWLTSRTFFTHLRDPGVFWARFVMYFALALMMGTLYLRMADDASRILDRASVLFFSVAFLCFMSIAALPAFLTEREIFVRERRNAYYGVSPYAVSHIAVGVPFIVLIAVAFAGVSYYMMNMNPGAEQFFYYLLALIASLMNAEALVTAISAVVPSFIIGIAAGAAIFGAYMLVCGFFLLMKNIPGWWIWMNYIVFHKYAFEGMMYNEFNGQNYTLPAGDCLFDYNSDGMVSGYEILSFYDYNGVHKWWWLLIVFGMAAAYYFVFYLCLRVLNKGER